jgi:Uma2 family endonuclease
MISSADVLTSVKWSVEDYHEMITAGILADRQVELLDGNIVEMPPVEPIHEDTGDELAAYLRSMLGNRAKVREGKAITLETSEPIPDIAIVENIRYREAHPQPRNIFLLIEIAKSRPARDIETKQKIYARAGIQDYWVLDLRHRNLRVFREPEGDSYRFDTIWSAKTISLLAFPQLELTTSRVMVN